MTSSSKIALRNEFLRLLKMLKMPPECWAADVFRVLEWTMNPRPNAVPIKNIFWLFYATLKFELFMGLNCHMTWKANENGYSSIE